MELHVHSLNIYATDAVVRHAHRRMVLALSRISHAVEAVVLRLKEADGPRETGKQCRVSIRLAWGEQVFIEDTDDDVYHVVDRVAGRAKCAVQRHLARHRDRRRRATP